MIERIGQALYGPYWASPLAEALGVSKRTVQQWASGRDPVPAGAWRDILALVQGREGEWPALIQEIRGMLK